MFTLLSYVEDRASFSSFVEQPGGKLHPLPLWLTDRLVLYDTDGGKCGLGRGMGGSVRAGMLLLSSYHNRR